MPWGSGNSGQFETAERLMKMLAILAAIALRLLAWIHHARIEPDMPGARPLWQGWQDPQMLTLMYRACHLNPNLAD
jgi:hypothetical protein